MRLVGATVGRFRVHEHLDDGAMAEVYRAQDVYSGEVVALEVLHAHLGGGRLLLGAVAPNVGLAVLLVAAVLLV